MEIKDNLEFQAILDREDIKEMKEKLALKAHQGKTMKYFDKLKFLRTF